MSVDVRLMNFRIADSDRTLLERISEHYSDASKSAILRRLIRNEAKSIGITTDDDTSEPLTNELQLETA